MSTERRVWIINDGGHDYSAAEKFGDVKHLTEGNISPLLVDRLSQDMGNTIGRLAREEDYLLLSGSAIVNILAVVFWLKLFGSAKILQWNAKQRDYELAVLDGEHLSKQLEEGLFP